MPDTSSTGTCGLAKNKNLFYFDPDRGEVLCFAIGREKQEMKLRFAGRASRLLILITYLSLACRFLLPVGYMPAPIANGWPARLCLTGLPTGFLADDAHHHGHHQTDKNSLQTCSFGACCSHEAAALSIALQISVVNDVPLPVAHSQNSIDTTFVEFRSRAPPA